MPRWESDAQGRLERAALDLFETQGFDRTTVRQITAAAGLRERSFYRYFPDKQGVLFAGDEVGDHLTAQVEATSPEVGPYDALLAAIASAEEAFGSREVLRRRVAVIAASPALAERDLIKLADIADTLAGVLERRGVEPGTARLLIDAAVAVARRATARWLSTPGATLSELVTEAAAELREVTAQPFGAVPPAQAMR